MHGRQRNKNHMKALFIVLSNRNTAESSNITKSCFPGEALVSISLIRIPQHFFIPHVCKCWKEEDPLQSSDKNLLVFYFLCSTHTWETQSTTKRRLMPVRIIRSIHVRSYSGPAKISQP